MAALERSPSAASLNRTDTGFSRLDWETAILTPGTRENTSFGTYIEDHEECNRAGQDCVEAFARHYTAITTRPEKVKLADSFTAVIGGAIIRPATITPVAEMPIDATGFDPDAWRRSLPPAETGNDLKPLPRDRDNDAILVGAVLGAAIVFIAYVGIYNSKHPYTPEEQVVPTAQPYAILVSSGPDTRTGSQPVAYSVDEGTR